MTHATGSRPRLLLLTQWFDPEATFKGVAFAKHLQARGFDVEVLTGFPNYPGGKVYPGYAVRWMLRETIDGVPITRVALYPSHDTSPVRRAGNYLSFGVTSFLYGLFGAPRPAVIYAYHPPLTVPLAAALIGKLRGAKVVIDIQDLWPDTLRATGMLSNTRALGLIGAVCNWLYRHVDRIVVLSPGFKRTLIARGVPEGQIEVIYNWCDAASLTAGASSSGPRLAGAQAFRIVFAGNIGRAQGLDAVLDAARILQNRGADIGFVFIGDGIDAQRLKNRVADSALANVSFMPRVSAFEVGGLLAQADALLVHLLRDPLFEITIPSKTQAYMAMGKPILMAVEGDAAALVTEAGCGVAAVPGNAESIAEAATALASMAPPELAKLGEAGREYYYSRLSIEAGTGRFANTFEKVLGGR